MKIGITGKLEGEPTGVVLVDETDARIFLQFRLELRRQFVDAKTEKTSLPEASGTPHRSKYLVAAVKGGETEERARTGAGPFTNPGAVGI
jgi:hypothetical protein